MRMIVASVDCCDHALDSFVLFSVQAVVGSNIAKVFQVFDWCNRIHPHRQLTQFGRSHINTVVHISVNTLERLGFPRMLYGL